MHTILANPPLPSAIIAANDHSAIGACDALKAKLLAPGKDIAVVGVDGIPLTVESSPQISTVVQPWEEMGTKAATLLLEEMQHPHHTAPSGHFFKGNLVIRQSSEAVFNTP